MSDRRQAAATAGVGAGLVAGGGQLRHVAAQRELTGMAKQPTVHALHMLPKAAKANRRLWIAGHGVGLVGAAPLAVGSLGLVRGKVEKVGPKDFRSGAALGHTGIGLGAGLGGASRRLPMKPRKYSPGYTPKPPWTPEQHAAFSLKAKKAAQMSNEVQREKRLGDHRSRQAIQRMWSREFNLEKAEDKRPLWREGLTGTATSLTGRTESLRTKQPHDVRATQVATTLGAGGLGGLAARGLLRHHGSLKPLGGPIAGVLAGTASIPLANHVIQRKHPEYEVTATGVKRKPTPFKRPSSKTFSDRPGPPRNLRADVGKADRDYTGRQISYRAQRAAVTGAGLTPGIGSIMAARQAGKYAPPGQQRQAAARQFTEGTVAGTAAGVAGAYGGAQLAHRSAAVARAVHGAERWKHNRVQDVRAKIGWERKAHDPESSTKALRELAGNRKALRPLARSLPAAGGALLGYHALKNVVGQAGAQHAISVNQKRQERYNSRYHLAKALSVQVGGPSKTERRETARVKRVNASLATVSGAAGLTSLGLLAARRKGAAVTTGIIGSGVGGSNALVGAHLQRREAMAIDPVKKALGAVAKGRQGVEITGSKDEHKRLIHAYGDRGPLPKGLDRDTKMKAYEARYVHAGGDKSEKWNHRANAAEGGRNLALATGTAGLAGLAALRHPRAAARMARHPRLSHRLDTAALSAGAAGGASELYGEYARHKRASYASSPGGVARSALVRMRSYTPGQEAA